MPLKANGIIEKLNLSDLGDSHGASLVINDQVLLIYQWIVLSTVCQIINIFGIVTNAINIVCFVNQGFKEPVNITLLGLSVSDLGSLTTMVWTCISLTPSVMAADIPYDSIEVMYLTSAMQHFVFTRVSSCITATITIERCVCITAPFKIKRIVNPVRATVIVVSIFIASICSAIPVYTVNKLDMKFSPVRNKTILGLVFMNDRENVEKISFIINNFSIPLVAFVIILVCTIILSLKLQTGTQWRTESTIQVQSDRVTSRNQKVAKMVVTISTLFIGCFMPTCIIMLALAFVPALSVQGQYESISVLIGGLVFVIEGINSSMNIFIYYHMSNKYRDVFCKLFFINRHEDNQR